jgi:hypothetical protein
MKNSRLSATLAWGMAGLGVALSGVGIVFAYQFRSLTLADVYFTWQARVIELSSVFFNLLIGGLIVTRRPENRSGWALLGSMFAVSLQTFVESLGIYGYGIAHWPDPVVVVLSALAGIAWFTWISLIALLLLWFPSGDYVSRRWRITGWVVAAGPVVGIVGAMIRPGPMTMATPVQNPLGVEGLGLLPDILLNGGAFAVFGMILLGVLSILIRFRRSVGEARQQIKWIAFGAAIFGIVLVSDFFVSLPGLWEAVKETLAFAVVPLSIGLAMLRYRLYDIDLIIRRTLVYSALTALLALTYFGLVIVLQGAVTSVGGVHAEWITVVSTLAVAALFAPLRGRVQAFIDRRFYRPKYNAAQALAEFAALARDETDLAALTQHLIRIVQATMQPEHATVWLARPPADAARPQEDRRPAP